MSAITPAVHPSTRPLGRSTSLPLPEREAATLSGWLSPQDVVQFGTAENPPPDQASPKTAPHGKAATGAKTSQPTLSQTPPVSAPPSNPKATATQGNWLTRQPRVWWEALQDTVRWKGNWKPGSGIGTDLFWSALVTLPCLIMPGTQLIFIPMGVGIGMGWRGLKTLFQGMRDPQKLIAERNREKAAEEAQPA